jgi:hypothetical protein
MSNDIDYTDKVSQIHPRAKDCFIIALTPLVLLICMAICGVLAAFLEDFDFGKVLFKILIGLLLVISMLQPLGILLGLYSLYKIRKKTSYSGKNYAIAGIIISCMIFIIESIFFFPAFFEK